MPARDSGGQAPFFLRPSTVTLPPNIWDTASFFLLHLARIDINRIFDRLIGLSHSSSFIGWNMTSNTVRLAYLLSQGLFRVIVSTVNLQ
jgi:hypothetical protein